MQKNIFNISNLVFGTSKGNVSFCYSQIIFGFKDFFSAQIKKHPLLHSPLIQVFWQQYLDMESEKPKEQAPPVDLTTTPPSQTKKPSQALYVPKQRLNATKNKTQKEVKPRPQYADKARKNAKNKKSRIGEEEKPAAVVGEDGRPTQNNNTNLEGKVEGPENVGVHVNDQPEPNSVEEGISKQLEPMSLEDEKGEDESWEKMFNEDGDCLEPHLLEEVKTVHYTE